MKVVVIGGGPSGVTSAIFAKNSGNSVVLLERNDKVLKKLLITGNGRCNYFNENFSIEHYYSNDIDVLKEIITSDNKDLFLEFFNDLGIVPFIKNDYYYPYSNMASSVRELLISKLNGCDVICNAFVKRIEKNDDEFLVYYNDSVISCDKVIISGGSKAYPKTGSDGSCYDIAKSFGHSINMVYPALTKFIGNEFYFKKWDGVRSHAEVSLYENDSFVKKEFGEVQFTKTGISGICIFNLSNIVSKGLKCGNKYEVRINFMSFTEDALLWFNSRSSKNIYSVLEGFLNFKLIDIILKACDIDSDCCFEDLDSSSRDKLLCYLTSFPFKVLECGSFDISQVCGGGVSLLEINPYTMESKIVSDLYFCGEILDVSGDCGGYNLAFAFISGILAGRSDLND